MAFLLLPKRTPLIYELYYCLGKATIDLQSSSSINSTGRKKKGTKHFNSSLDIIQVLDVTLKFPATVELRVIILILKGGRQRD